MNDIKSIVTLAIIFATCMTIIVFISANTVMHVIDKTMSQPLELKSA